MAKSKRPSRLIRKEHSYSLTPKAKTIQVLVWNENGADYKRIRNTKVNRDKINKIKGKPQRMQELIGKGKFLFWP